MEIDVAHAGVLFLSDLVDVTGASRHAQLKLDSGKFFLKAGLEFLPQLCAGWNGNYDPAFPSRPLNRPFPFRTFALRRLT